MACGIYKITNLINQKSYIGQAIDISRRWRDEKNRAFDPNSEEYKKTLSVAIRKYGIDNFSFEILEECKVSELNTKEQYYIKLYDTYFNGYNETTGGDGNSNACIKISKDNLLKIYNLLQNTNISQGEIAKQFSVGQDVISTINHGKSRRLDGYTFPLRDNSKKINYCCDCGKVLSSSSSKRCIVCEHLKQRKSERPNREELKILIRTMPFTKIGEKYSVSDNTIRKWCTAENLPTKKRQINNYTDEEWELI